MPGLLDTKPSEIGKSMFKQVRTAAQGTVTSTTQSVKSQVFGTQPKQSADLGKMIETNTTNTRPADPLHQANSTFSPEEMQKMAQENAAKDTVQMQKTREQLAAEMHQTEYYKPLIEKIGQIKEQREKIYSKTEEQKEEEKKQMTTTQGRQEKDNWFQRFFRVKRSGEGGKQKG